MAVLRGRVRISSVSGDGKEVTLNVISPGEIFGEIALLDGEPRSTERRDRGHPAAGGGAPAVPAVPCAEPGPVLRLLAVLCDRLRRTSMALEEIALFDLPARLARVLLKLAGGYGRPGAGRYAHRP